MICYCAAPKWAVPRLLHSTRRRAAGHRRAMPVGMRFLTLPLSPPKPSSAIACRPHSDEASTGGPTLREICEGRVPDRILQRCSVLALHLLISSPLPPSSLLRYAAGLKKSDMLCRRTFSDNPYPSYSLDGTAYSMPRQGSGKTLAYLLLIFSTINFHRSAVQALIVVPTRELGIQVARVARMLAAKPMGFENLEKSCTIMALLDGGMLKRHKSWLKAEPPEIVVATLGSLCQMLEKHVLCLEAMQVLIIDEVDYIFSSSKQVYALRKLLTSYSTIDSRQTVFASASIPQHNHFRYDCVQQKWTKNDVIHIHVNPVDPMPSHLYHKFVICSNKERLVALLSLLQKDAPKSGIIFVGEQSEKSRKAGNPPSTTLVIEYLKASYSGCLEVLLLEEAMNFNARATSFSEVRQGGCLLVATDLASRGVDLPQTTHIYNFDLPRSAVGYLHRAGRTGRMPFSKDACSSITSLITHAERFVLQRFENELMFQCEELLLESLER